MISLALASYSPQDNPDRMFLTATFSGNYGVNGGVGDTLNLTPVQQGSNPNGVTDPKGIYGLSINGLPDVPPGNFSESLAGGTVQPALGATLATCVLRCFAANGNELAQGAAYPPPANFLAGQVTLEILMPTRTQS